LIRSLKKNKRGRGQRPGPRISKKGTILFQEKKKGPALIKKDVQERRGSLGKEKPCCQKEKKKGTCIGGKKGESEGRGRKNR